MATTDTSAQSAPKNGSSISNDKNPGTTMQSHGSSSNELAKHAKDTVSHVAEQAANLVGTQITQQQKRSAGELGSVTKALRGAREELGDSFAAPMVDRAADEIERATKFLESASMSDIVDGVESFARREPLLFLGGAFAVGMLGARFLKSSSRRNTDTFQNGSWQRTTQPMRAQPMQVPRPSPSTSSSSSTYGGTTNIGLGNANGNNKPGRLP